jgi:hypothetical protein
MTVSIDDLKALWGEKLPRELKPVSEATGVPVGTIKNIVRGRTKHPRIDTFSKLAAEYERQITQ